MESTEQKRLEASLRQLGGDLQRERDRLQLLREIDTTLASIHDLPQLFAAITSCIAKVIPYDFAGTWLYNAADHTMEAAALDSRVGELFHVGEAMPIGACLLGESMLARTIGVLNFAQLQAIPLPCARQLLEHGIKSACGLPLITPNGALGGLGLGSRNDQAFSPEDVDLLSHAANSMALALENALTKEALKREKAHLQVLLEVSLALSRPNLDFHKAFPAISASIQTVVPNDLIVVKVVDPPAATVRVYALDNRLPLEILPQDHAVPVQETFIGQFPEESQGGIFSREELEAYALRLPRLRPALDAGMQSLGYVPLRTTRGLLGGLFVGRKARALTDQDLRFLKRLASEFALAVETATIHEALVREKERLQALSVIDDALAGSLDLHQILPVVSASLRRTLPHDHLAICLYDERVRGLRDYTATSEVKRKIFPPDGVLPLESSLTGQAFRQGMPNVCNHEDLLQVPFAVTRRAVEAGIRSACFIPLVSAKARMGVLTISSETDCAFTREDFAFLDRVAAALAQSLQNALAHKALRGEKKRLQVLLNVSAALAAKREVHDAFPEISAYLRRVLRHEYASFLLFDEKSGLWVRQAMDFPLGRGLSDNLAVMHEKGPAGLALRNFAPMTFSRQEMEDFHVEITDCFLAEGIQSLCCVPLIRPKSVLGVLVVGSTRTDAFGPDDVTLLKQVAAQLAVALENQHAWLEVEALKGRLSAERKYLQVEIGAELNFEDIVGQSPVLKETLKQVETVAGSDATVLVLGETGTGKELVARAIHRASKRRDRSFIKVNCAAIPTGLLESELFGHEKGAFTGAISRKLGRLELADHGTLFLDEVGEIPRELQPKLLRVLQDHEFERLGGTRTIKVDLRLIAATNRNLSRSVSENQFRSDLFYRLNVFPIRVPSLRERREDIPLLVRHFVRLFARRYNRNIETIPTDTMTALLNWDWPGNVRELENFLERCLLMSQGSVLLAPLAELQASNWGQGPTGGSTLENAEREHILRVLRESGGVISGPTGAAHRLGLKRSTLQSKMERLGIRRREYTGEGNA